MFADYTVWLLGFVVVLAGALWLLPGTTRAIVQRLGATRVSEPEVKFLFLVLFGLGGLASAVKSEAVLPAHLVGLVVAGVFLADRVLMHRMRSVAFALLTPFYFVKAGLYVSLPVVAKSVLLIGALLLLKMVAKVAGGIYRYGSASHGGDARGQAGGLPPGGRVSGPAVLAGLALGPIMIAGSWMGKRILDRLPERVFMILVEITVAGAGFNFLFRG